MNYELTEYGREYLETAGERLDRMWDSLPKETTPEGLTRIKRSSSWDRLNKRITILNAIRGGLHPVVDSFSFLKEGPRKERAMISMGKALDLAIKDGLVRPIKSKEVIIEGDFNI